MKKTTYAADSNIYLIINNGARVTQGRYRKFAEYLAACNINAITYDYTDMTESKLQLRTSEVSLQQWAGDMEVIIDEVSEKNSQARIFVLGHSLGGQIIGLSKSCPQLSGIILVAAQTGYWKYWPFPLNLANYLVWNYYIPGLLKVRGFLPRGLDRELDHMPRAAATEWAKWCRSPNYLFDHIPEQQRYFDRIRCPLLALSFNNDIYATRPAVDWLTAQYKNAKTQRKHYQSKISKYYHSSLFEPDHFSTIGQDVIRFIESHGEQH